ncbi:DUF4349 domain-containing protein [Lutispora sp.]|uniref:DUF4349 domain-containing protein n=1 Tax=Lutispora sp. TaxID=2828727 RepID=UPI00356743DF
MDCEVVRSLMSSYIDKDINEIDRIELEKHLESCSDCMEEYNLLLATVTYCNQLEEIELPETFHQDLMGKIQELGSNKPKKSFFKRNWNWVAGVAAVFVVAAIGLSSLPGLPGLNTRAKSIAEETGRGYGGAVAQSAPAEAPAAEPAARKSKAKMEFSESMNMASVMDNGANYALTMGAPEEDTVTQEKMMQSEAETYERKIITSGSISLEVTDFDNKMESIADLAERNGGYVESSYVDNIINHEADGKSDKLKTGNITLRLPAARFGSAVEEIKTMGEVINQNTNSIDISEQYYDTATRIDNLTVQENRLRELISKAQNVDEILKIENELNRVRSEIELMSTDIKRWDKQVSLSTLYVNLREIKAGKLESVNVPTVWTKAYNGFVGTINSILRGGEKLFVFIVSAIPYLIILAVLTVIGYIVYKKRFKKK